MNTDKAQTPEYSQNGVGRLNKHSYRDGYLHSRGSDSDVPQEKYPVRTPVRDNKNSQGLILGIKLAVIATLVGITSFLWVRNHRQSTTPLEAAPVPTRSQPQNP